MANLVRTELRVGQFAFQACVRRAYLSNRPPRGELTTIFHSSLYGNPSRIISRNYSINKKPEIPREAKTEGNNSPIVGGDMTGSNNRTIIFGGMTVFALGAAGLALYLYCEKATDHELCDSLRDKIGLKKK